MVSRIDQLKNIYANIPKSKVIGSLKERLESASESVRGWFVTPTPEVTSLNQKFVEKIQVVSTPFSRKEFVVSAVVMVACAVLAAYSIGWVTAGSFGWNVMGVLGGAVGGWGVIYRIQAIAHAVSAFKCRKASAEERLFKQYNQYSQAEIQVKFKHYTGCDIDQIYTSSQKQEILTCTQATTIEQAVIPALIRLILLQEEYDALQKKVITDLSYIPEDQGGGAWYSYYNELKEVWVSAEDVDILLQHEKTLLQNLYTKKIELAFSLAILLYPDEIKCSSLDQMGSIHDYSKHSSFVFYNSNLPFFVSYPPKSVHTPRVRPILCSELESMSPYTMARLFAFPGNK